MLRALAHGRFRGPLLLCCLLLLTVLLPSGAAKAAGPKPAPSQAPTATFGIGPANAKKIDGRPYLNFVASAGARFVDHVAVVNVSDHAQLLSLYVTDATNAADGSFAYPAAADRVKEAGAWISVLTPGHGRAITLPARTTLVYPIQVAVPSDASPGDHAAAVVVSLTALSTNKPGQQVNLEQRVALRAFFRVSGPLRPALHVEALKTSYASIGTLSGSATVTYRVRNSGNVKLGGRQRVDVSGPFVGTSKAGAAVLVLLPGGSIDVTTVVDGVVPQVRMTAKVTVTPLGVTGDTFPATRAVVSSVRFWAVPSTVLLILLLLLLLAGGLRRRRARRASGPPARHVRTRGVEGRLPADVVVRARRSGTRAVGLVSAATAVLLAGAGAPAAWAGDALPYNDSAVTGSVGLCDVNGKNVMSGRITDKPFVWRAVGTTAAKDGYDASGRTAFLSAFQPRKGVDPGSWNGFQLAANSRYTNPKHPMSQATPISSPLTGFLERYPAQWQGLVQLRLLLGGSGRSPLLTRYDATDIVVKDGSWRVVRGGTGPCNDGKATSVSVLLNVPGAKGTPKPGAQAPVVAGSRAAPAGVTSAPSVPGHPAATGSTPRASSSKGIAGGSTTVFVLAGIGALVVGGLLTVGAVRHRSAS